MIESPVDANVIITATMNPMSLKHLLSLSMKIITEQSFCWIKFYLFFNITSVVKAKIHRRV